MDLSAGYVLSSFAVGTVGFGFFIYGKKQVRMPQLVAGLALSIEPYVLGSPTAILGAGAASLLALWIALRAGL